MDVQRWRSCGPSWSSVLCTCAEFDAEGNLFAPDRRMIDQEWDLYFRMKGLKMNICLHTGTFVFHYKVRF